MRKDDMVALLDNLELTKWAGASVCQNQELSAPIQASPAYLVLRIPQHEARDPVSRMWQENLPIRQDACQTFEWKYQRAPESHESHLLLCCAKEGRVEHVGSVGICPRPFKAGFLHLRAALMADLSVTRAHRTKMPAQALVLELKKEALARFDFAYGSPNKLAVGLFLRSGFQQLGTMTRYVCVLHLKTYVKRLLKSGILSKVASSLLDLVMLGRMLPGLLQSIRHYRFHVGPAIEDEVDQLVVEASRDYPLLGSRSASWLRWRYRQGLTQAEFFRVFRKDQKRSSLRGYAVIRQEGTMAHILDLLAPFEEVGALLNLLLPWLWLKGAQCASFRFFGQPQLVQLLQSHGFVARESEQAVIFARDERYAHFFDPHDPGQWYFTHADEDV